MREAATRTSRPNGARSRKVHWDALELSCGLVVLSQVAAAHCTPAFGHEVGDRLCEDPSATAQVRGGVLPLPVHMVSGFADASPGRHRSGTVCVHVLDSDHHVVGGLRYRTLRDG